MNIRDIEQTAGGVMTYTAATVNASVGAWLGEHWFLVISAVAVVVRIYIDIQNYRRRNK